LPNSGGTDFVAADPNFSLLKAAGVSFYDGTLNVPATPGAVAIPTAPGASAGPNSPTMPVTTTDPTAAVPLAEPVAPTDPAISA